jgi:Lysozyme like domain
MTPLSMDQIAQYAYNAGFRGKDLSVAVAVSKAENRTSDPSATHRNANGTTDTGLWQINSSNYPVDAMKDPTANARAAYVLAHNARGWRNWTTYNAGIYLLWLPQAEVAAQRVEHLGGAGAIAAEAGTHVPGLGSGTENIGQAGLSGLSALPETFNRVGAWISNPDNWERVLYVIVGGGLILVAISNIAKPVTEPIVKAAGKVPIR